MTTAGRAAEKIDITLAKGIGIILVVVGHILARGTSEGNHWFTEVTDFIYLFHMAFFMALSGYVFFRPGRAEQKSREYMPFILSQARRLLIPFFALGIIVLAGKMIAGHFLHVDNQPLDLTSGLAGLFWHTAHSPSTFIWYIFVLFVYTAIMPLVCRYVPKGLYAALGVGIVLYFMPTIEYLYLDKLLPFFVFFILGGVLRAHEDDYLSLLDRYVWRFAALFAASFCLHYMNMLPLLPAKLIIGTLSVPALHGVCRLMMAHQGKVVRILSYLGSMTLVIYLFNTICIGVTKGVMFKVMDWDGLNFFIFLPVLIVAGILGPLILRWMWVYGLLWRRGQRRV